ncbi:substrate-binding periplasmic protein [Spartinivicinus ruber]|uniref:substrate-binding periplasmic protein n=1 Tax=Spartinivicinus ruber TaxID=2683272 RepID=UPI0013D65303|nr:transporter substrate-binding domain-containing protein [Spartinivicinus ruber]
MDRLIAFILIVFSTVSLCGEKILITAGSWPPHISRDLADYGTSTQIVSAAFASEGIDIEYRFLPWKRAFVTSLNGISDGTILWAKTSEREQNFYISDPVKVYQWVFFHLKDYDFDWKTLADLKGVMIGATRGPVEEPSKMTSAWDN